MVAEGQLLLFAAGLNVLHHLDDFLGEVVNHLQSFVAVTSPSIWNRCEASIFIPGAFFAPYSSILAVGADITVTLATVWANRLCTSMWRDADDRVKGGAEET